MYTIKETGHFYELYGGLHPLPLSNKYIEEIKSIATHAFTTMVDTPSDIDVEVDINTGEYEMTIVVE